MYQLLYLLYEFVLGCIATYLVISTGYMLLFSLLSRLGLSHTTEDTTLHSFVVLIPAYKEDKIIKEVAHLALQHNYPKELFDVYVVADSLQPSTIEHLRTIGATVIEVEFESSTKAKSLNAAIAYIGDTRYSHACILDVDNIMEQDCLLQLNASLQRGIKVVQGHRTAKNLNTPTAILDAISEEVNNTIFRKGQRALGLSAMIIGSGFAIEWSIFKEFMSALHDVAGEDRELDIRLVEHNIDIEYNANAIIYDEKVTSWDIYTRQRTRWSAAQVDFVKNYFIASIVHLFTKGNIQYFNHVCANLILPRSILLFVVIILGVVSILIPEFPYSRVFILSAIFIIVAVSISIPARFYNLNLLKALLHAPAMVLAMLRSLTKMKGQSKQFLHTPHSYENPNKETEIP